MDLEIHCLSCGEQYFCTERNTKIFGPIIEVTCPKCNHFVSKNYSAFLFDQTNHMDSKVGRARVMISLARAISKIISNEESFKKKKK